MRFRFLSFLTSKIRWPRLRLPHFSLPSLSLPRISLPTIPVPRFSLPRINMPRVQVPTVRWPSLSLPRPTLPSIHFPKISLPTMRWRLHIRLVHNLALLILWVLIIIGIGGGVYASGFDPIGAIRNSEFVKIVQIQAPVRQRSEEITAEMLNSIMPAAGVEEETPHHFVEEEGRYTPENSMLRVESVLIPHDTTVISSSKDSKIKHINFDNGELFKKGDILVEYSCKDVKAEVDIARIQQELAQKKSMTSYKLFKLDIISDLEKQELETENKQAEARTDLYESRMEDCFIRAEYDGRVVKRLANPGEFTRTDRVLMEVASLNDLKAEFLLPSRWLRWVNVGAPITVSISETDKTYSAIVKYIYGEVDPVSQSIQVTAQLNPYDDPLLPGMSGQAVLDVQEIRRSGIYGFLEKKPDNYGQ